MSWQIHISPLVPFWLSGGMVAISAALLLAGLAMGKKSIWLRAPLLFLIVLILLNPSLRREEREPIPDVVTVVLDQSASQDVGGRLETAEATLNAIRQALEDTDDIEVRVARTGGGDEEAEADGTRLFTALDQLSADVPPDRLAGAILITDGQVHDVPASGRPAGFDAPVHTLITGAQDLGDRKLTVLNAPAFGLVGKTAMVRIRIDDLGEVQARGAARLTVRLNGAEIANRLAPIGEPLDLPIEIPHSGSNVVELAVEPGGTELTLLNNRVALTVNGVRDRLKVLLVSGEPHAGQRTWRNLLKSDPAVDLVHFTILRPPDKQDFTRPDELALIEFPTDELFDEKLYDFDLIIFDRFKRRGVLNIAYLGNVARYVERGGALLTAAGPAFAGPASLHRTPLSAVFPAQPTGEVVETGYRPRVTGLGQRHPVTADLPGANEDGSDAPQWGQWFRLIEAERLSGAVTMTGPDDRPLLVLDRFGEGRVAQLLSDHAWLWARGFEGGGPQQELLRRLAHWLMKEPELEEEDLSARARGKSLEITRRTMADQVPPVTVTTPSGETETVTLEEAEPGLWRQTVEAEDFGLYRLESGDLSAVAAVGPLTSREFADVRATDETLAPVAQATGGGQYWVAEDGPDSIALPAIRRVRADRAASGRGWLGLVDNRRYEVRASREVSLIHPALWAGLLIGLALLAWRWESR